MEQLKCKNCGAPLDESGKCQYCGSRYRIEQRLDKPYYIEVYHSPVETLECGIRLGMDTVDRIPEDELGNMTAHEIARKMAENLGSFIKFQKDYDPFTNSVMIRGKIRVVPPDFRF